MTLQQGSLTLSLHLVPEPFLGIVPLQDADGGVQLLAGFQRVATLGATSATAAAQVLPSGGGGGGCASGRIRGHGRRRRRCCCCCR